MYAFLSLFGPQRHHQEELTSVMRGKPALGRHSSLCSSSTADIVMASYVGDCLSYCCGVVGVFFNVSDIARTQICSMYVRGHVKGNKSAMIELACPPSSTQGFVGSRSHSPLLAKPREVIGELQEQARLNYRTPPPSKVSTLDRIHPARGSGHTASWYLHHFYFCEAQLWPLWKVEVVSTMHNVTSLGHRSA